MDVVRRSALVETGIVAAAVTGAVTLASATMPDAYVATSVAFLFLGATWATVWRREDVHVERAGLAFGGLVMPGKVDGARMAQAALRASLWAVALAVVVFVPFFFGWRWWWHPSGHFAFSAASFGGTNAIFGQLVIIALPEEAFYRGYLQSRLDGIWAPRIRIAGADVGLGLVVSSVIFALGHVATIHDPSRLAVFFPSLVFGWLRARTGGIGASVLFHALCNLFSEALGRGYGVYG